MSQLEVQLYSADSQQQLLRKERGGLQVLLGYVQHRLPALKALLDQACMVLREPQPLENLF